MTSIAVGSKPKERADPPPVLPVFKWPGGKRALVPYISEHVPTDAIRLIEPFCGGAALFFSCTIPTAHLADSNALLINAYRQIRDNIDQLILELQHFENSSSFYYKIRASSPRSQIGRAARLLYLMRLSFNGIYRENLKGEFNVPYGYKTTTPVFDEQHLRDASRSLQRATLATADYRHTLITVRERDVVYADPPYTVAHNNNGFLKYNQRLFSWKDQIALARQCHQARLKGACVVVSNADTPDIRKLYDGFEYHVLSRYSSISGNSSGRRHVSEALFVGPPY